MDTLIQSQDIRMRKVCLLLGPHEATKKVNEVTIPKEPKINMLLHDYELL